LNKTSKGDKTMKVLKITAAVVEIFIKVTFGLY
jgi:hypothetical protein